jgi:6,7-dimethyl-8-ribityllumazine synthase
VKTASSLRPDATGLRILVLRSAFNAEVVEGLVEGALLALDEMGAGRGQVDVETVPGAFELPLAARCAAASGRFDAIVTLGAVIKGETDHYEHIARECAAGLEAAARETGVPVGFGVLTVAEEAQARARAAPGPENKGAEAARAAVEMVHVLRRLKKRTEPQRHRGTEERKSEGKVATTGTRKRAQTREKRPSLSRGKRRVRRR